jgi:hypothetical protein
MKLAQKTFALLMQAQKTQGTPSVNDLGPSYQYFNNSDPLQSTPAICYKCTTATIYDRCSHCEHTLCQNCLQQCNSCQHLYCTTCSNIE